MSESVHYLGGIGDWIEFHARWRGDLPALVDGERRLTYRELNDRVDRLAGALAARGLVKGDRLAGLMLNSIPFIETAFACAKLGAV
jgi:fatty-acyl-CoA synthase